MVRWGLALAVMGWMLAGPAGAQTVSLKASHQFPGGQGDLRDEMVQIIAREAAQSNLGMEIKVFPGASLFKPKEQWNAIVKGQLDITAFPLDYAAGKHPQFNLTLMPGLVKNHEHATRLNLSPFMAEIKKIMDQEGVMVLADVWLAGAFASKKNCLLEPADIKGQMARAAGPSFEQMLAAAGASISSMASSEVYSAMQTGVLDAVITSSESFVSFRLFEQIKCITAPGDNALWFMYQPILMSKKSFAKLSDAQKKVIIDAGKKAESFATKAAKDADANMVAAFKKNNVQVVFMTAAQAGKWMEIAKAVSYKKAADEIPGGKDLVEKALSVK